MKFTAGSETVGATRRCGREAAAARKQRGGTHGAPGPRPPAQRTWTCCGRRLGKEVESRLVTYLLQEESKKEGEVAGGCRGR